MQSGRKLFLAAAAAAVVACVPATANAAVSATVTGDDGNPAGLTAGVPLGIRNMNVQAAGHVDAADAKSFIVKVIGPDGVAATTNSPCWDTRYTNESKRYVDYRGNGTYTLVTSLYSDTNCTTGQRDVNFPWTVSASVAISPPAPTMLTRAVNSFSTITQQFNFAGNPGASGYEIKYAKGAVVQPDGSLVLAGAQGRLPEHHDRQGRAVRRARAGHVHDRRPCPLPATTTRRGARRRTST